MLSECAMIDADRLQAMFPRAFAVVEARLATLKKAVSFALIGFINLAIDTGVFFLVYFQLMPTRPAMHTLALASVLCRCGTPASLALVVSNVTGWAIAVSSSYVMNSFITFALESGRQLRWRDYATFVASGVLGVTASTATLVLAAAVMPVWAAKACSVLAGFVVNFSMSHFVVFRSRPAPVPASSVDGRAAP